MIKDSIYASGQEIPTNITSSG